MLELEPQEITIDVLKEKYFKNDESNIDELYKRVASGIAKAEKEELRDKYEKIFYSNLIEGGVGAGRIMSAAGTDLTATLINCFVIDVGDSIEGVDEDGHPGIYESVKFAACTMRRGGGVGYNFSKIRPKGAQVKSLDSVASGPCSYIDVFDISCLTIESAGSRRGAQLAALNIDHPDILDFIKAKRTKGRWNNFNISVLVPDSFMKAKERDDYIELVHKAKPGKELLKKGLYQREDGKWVYGKIKAKELWEIIMKSNYDYAEPGILFEDNINRDNNLRYIEYIDTTNPCVVGSTIILTKLGCVPISNLVNDEVTIWNGYEWSIVTPRVTGENKEIYDITLSDGSILPCTSNHTFILKDNTKTNAEKLSIGSVLAKPNYPVIEGIVAEDLFIDEYKFDINNVPINLKTIEYRLKWLGDFIDNYAIKFNNRVEILYNDKDILLKTKYLLNTLGCNGNIKTDKAANVNMLIIYGYDIDFLKRLGLKTVKIDIDNIVCEKNDEDLVVVSKEKRLELEPKVYCFTEPKKHTGVFNGILTGNCGEQPLPVNGCCDLGPIILPKLVNNPFTENASFNFDKLKEIVRVQTRFLDNVLDVTIWPLEEQRIEAMNKRRIGIGFTGLANALAMLNKLYYSEDGLDLAEKIAKTMRDTAYDESVNLAIEKGSFPLFNAEKYLEEGTFASRLPDYIKHRIKENGIRNSHLLSVAPVGTVSLAFADNASNGIEPPFSLAYTRKKRTIDGGHRFYNVLDHSFRVWLNTQDKEFAKVIEDAVCNYKDKFVYNEKEYIVKDILPKSLVTALEMTPEQHLLMMKTIQPYICSSISKTINCPADIPFEKYMNIYDKAWEYRLKGVSTYRPNDILGSVLSVPTEPTTKPVVVEKTTNIDNGKTLEEIVDEMYHQKFDSRDDGMLPGISIKGRFYTNQGEQKFIITINFLKLVRETPHGTIAIRRPVEFLLTSNFATSKSSWDTVTRFLSLMSRSGVSLTKAIENLKEITWEHGPVRYGTIEKNGKKVPLWHNSDAAAIGYIIEEALIKEGYLNSEGKLAYRYTLNEIDAKIEDNVSTYNKIDTINKEEIILPPTGKKCPECGAYNLEKRDGCERCSNCNYEGACG